MRVLIVCSGNVENFDFKIHQSFIYDQIEAIKTNYNIDYDVFLIKGKGIKGYLGNYRGLRQKIDNYLPDIIHAHYSLSGLLAILQNKIPVIVTFHGSDCIYKRVLSTIVHLKAKYSIFVSKHLYNNLLIRINKKSFFIKCGVNTENFKPLENQKLMDKIIQDNNRIKILFASAFNNAVKNYSLAQKAISYLSKSDEIDLIELKNKTREEVNLLLNSVNLLLLTSLSEGSPQIIKEAMACNCPIVSTDVGDIREIIGNTEGCFVTTFDPQDIAGKIKMAIKFSKTICRTNGREKIMIYDNKIIASLIYEIYKKIANG